MHKEIFIHFISQVVKSQLRIPLGFKMLHNHFKIQIGFLLESFVDTGKSIEQIFRKFTFSLQQDYKKVTSFFLE